MYSSQCARTATSAALNFHKLAGWSRRAMKRRFCSAFETWRKNLTIFVPFPIEVALEGVDAVVAASPEFGPAIARGRFCLSSHSGWTRSATTSS
jgi:hypothetical protein